MAKPKPETLKLGQQRRVFGLAELGQRNIDEEARTVDLVFSSEAAVIPRWWGNEILGHGKGEVDLARAKAGHVPLLVNHDPDRQVGTVVSAKVEGGRGIATVRFSRSAMADEVFRDVVDGIRESVSVGYALHKLRLEGEEDGVSTYRAIKWELFEISLVSIPADTSVGVGRSGGEGDRDVPVVITEREGAAMDPEETIVPAAPAATVPPVPAAVRSASPEAGPEDAIRAERQRIADIQALAVRHNRRDLGDRAAREGTSLAAFRGILLDAIPAGTPLETPPTEIGMTGTEARSFSLFRALYAQARHDWRNAGLERAAIEAVATRMLREANREARGFFLPYDVMAAPAAGRRDLTAGGAGTGAELVGTDHLAGSFIELLRNKALVRQLGARVLSGLVGDVEIPKQSGGGTAYWLATEATDVTESNQATGAVTLSPNTVAARTDLSHKLLKQSSPSAEALVRDDLTSVLALAVDAAVIAGSGSSGQPEGILNISGIGDVAGGTNGLAPTWAHMVALETDVAVGNADVGNLAYLTTVQARGKLKTTEKAANTAQFVWQNMAGMPGVGEVNGYRAFASNQVPSDLDKGTSTGVCSAIIFGNWADVLIGEWGVLDLTSDPFTLGDRGGLVVRAFADVDTALRHVASMSAMQDALTA